MTTDIWVDGFIRKLNGTSTLEELLKLINEYTDGGDGMSLRELLNRLKPYPVLQSLVLESLTTEEWEALVSFSEEVDMT